MFPSSATSSSNSQTLKLNGNSEQIHVHADNFTSLLNTVQQALDRLQQQVLSNQIRIAAACSRLEHILTSLGITTTEKGSPLPTIDADSRRCFLTLLPRILATLLGDDGTHIHGSSKIVGWIEINSLDYEGLISIGRVLSPDGPIFLALLSLQIHKSSINSASYEMPSSLVLPPSLQGTTSVNNLPPTFAKITKDNIVRFNSIEYFLFRIVNLLIFPPPLQGNALPLKSWKRKFQSQDLSMSIEAPLHSSLITPANSSIIVCHRFSNDLIQRLYKDLCESYLQFFIPSEAPKNEGAFGSSFLHIATRSWSLLGVATTFYGLISELWLHRYSYDIDLDGKVSSTPAQASFTTDHVECVGMISKHVVHALLQVHTTAAASSSSSNSKMNPLDSLRKDHWENVVDAMFVVLREYLYSFLRISYESFNRQQDGCFEMQIIIGNIWSDFCTPWSWYNGYLDRTVRTSYLSNNYLFSHTFLKCLLETVHEKVSFYGKGIYKLSLSGGSNEGECSNNDSDDRHYLLEKELTPLLRPILLLLVRTLTSLDVGNRCLLKDNEKERNVFVGSRKLTSRKGDLNEQIMALEAPSYTMELLFSKDSPFHPIILRILFWLEYIFNSTISPTATTTFNQQHQQHLSFSKSHQFSSEHFLKENQRSSDIHPLILQCEEEICDLFSIKEDEYDEWITSFKESLKTELLSVQTPLIVSPESFDPRFQWEKRCSPFLSVGNTKTSSTVDVIKSYEIDFLVHLSRFLDRKMKKSIPLLKEALSPFVYDMISRFSFRFLASIPNLFWISVGILLLRIIIFIL